MNQMTLIMFILLHVKHFLADFPFQTPYMLGKAKKGFAWLLPLTSHCAVHAFFSALIITLFKPQMVWVAGIEFIAHFIIDKLKVSYKLPQGQWDNSVKGQYLSKFYMAFGADQLAHQLTYLLMVYFIV